MLMLFGCALLQACIRECVCRVVQAPFTYEALPPEKINFVPLKQKRSFNGRELMQVWHFALSNCCFWLRVFAIFCLLIAPWMLDQCCSIG